jgi:hypothetical protein
MRKISHDDLHGIVVVRAGAEGANFPSARYCASTVNMTEQETLLAQKRRGPPPTGKGTQVVVRLQPDDLELLDLWIEANVPDASRPEAMRRILRLVAMRVPR